MLVFPVAIPGIICNGKGTTALKHEGNGRRGDLHHGRIRLGSLGKLLIGHAVRDEAALEGDAARLELVRAAAVVAVDEAHELRGAVAVVVGRAVRVRRDVPARGEDEEVGQGCGGVARPGRQHAKDGRVNVVDGDGADIDKLCEVVLVGDVVAVPRNHVKGAVPLGAVEELASQLVYNVPRVVLGHLVGGDGMQKVAGIGETVCAEGAELGQLKAGAPDLEDVASGRTLDADAKSLSALDDADLARLHVQETKLGLDVEGALLRHNEKVTIGIDKGSLGHALVAEKDVSCQALTQCGISGAGNSFKAVYEIHVLARWDLKWLPRQLCRRDMDTRVQWKKT